MDTMPTPGTRLRIDGTDCGSLNGSTGTALAEDTLLDGRPLGPASIHGVDADSDEFLWVQIDRDEAEPVYAFRLSEVTPIPEDTPPRSLYNDAIPTPDHLTHDPTSGDLNWPRKDPK